MANYLVTGASGGVGLAIVKKLIKEGHNVFGLDIKEGEFTDKNYTFILTDITSEKSVKDAYVSVRDKVNALSGIINTAGIMFMGSAIECDSEVMQKIMDVNVNGTFRLNNVFFPLLENGKGRIVNFSSEYGKYTGIPFHSFYTASKHAIEAYSDSLRRELNYLGLKVIVIRPGAIDTPMTKSTAPYFEKIKAETTHYKKTYEKLYPMLINGTKNPVSPELIANKVYKSLTKKRPKRHYNIHWDWRVKLLSKLPSKLVDFIFKKVWG